MTKWPRVGMSMARPMNSAMFPTAPNQPGHRPTQFHQPTIPTLGICDCRGRQCSPLPARSVKVTGLDFRQLIGIFGQNLGPTCNFWANPVTFALGLGTAVLDHYRAPISCGESAEGMLNRPGGWARTERGAEGDHGVEPRLLLDLRCDRTVRWSSRGPFSSPPAPIERGEGWHFPTQAL